MQYEPIQSIHFPACPNHPDCFANKMGKCICLNDNKFHRDCPFYKNNENHRKELLRCGRYLRQTGQTELLEKYKLLGRTTREAWDYPEEE